MSDHSTLAYRAHLLFISAQRRDERLSAQVCEACAATPAQAHHDDYSRPLDVRWLCQSCHRLTHIYGTYPWAALSAALFLRSEGVPVARVARLTGLNGRTLRRWLSRVG